MPATSTVDYLASLHKHLDKAVKFSDLVPRDWKRQTDVVQEAFMVAALFIEFGDRAVFVDGHIDDHLKRAALESSEGVRSFFNRRFHDAGLKTRRIIVYDTISTNKMGKRGSGRAKLHFHGVFEVPNGGSRAELKRRLAKIFGHAEALGERQFHVSTPRWDQHHTHNGVQVAGPLGKIMYAVAHAGSTYNSLQLNDGKRSRSSPPSRGPCNRKGAGLARGIPSNFNASVVFADHASKRAGKAAFALWIAAEQEARKPVRYGRVDHASPAPLEQQEAV